MILVAVVVLMRQGKIFLQRRSITAAVLPGLWELPGGKLEPGEGPEVAVRREVMEELGLTLGVLRPLLPQGHGEGVPGVLVHPFQASAQARPTTDLAWGWFTPREALRLPLPPATRPVLESLERELSTT